VPTELRTGKLRALGPRRPKVAVRYQSERITGIMGGLQVAHMCPYVRVRTKGCAYHGDMNDEAVRLVVDDVSTVRRRPPKPSWALVVLVVLGIGLIWSITTNETSTESAPLNEDVDANGSFERARKKGSWVSVGGSGPTGHLRGDVVLSSPKVGDVLHQTVWVLRPGGSVVRRDHVPSYSERSREREDGMSPIVMVDDRIMVLDGTMSYVLNSDLVDPHVPVGPARWIVAGATPHLAWLVGQLSVDGADIDWVTPVDTGDLTVGDRLDVADVIRWTVVAAGDGLVVHPVDVETNGRYAYWSPLGGLKPLAIPDPESSSVLAASGSLVAAVSLREISVIDIDTGLTVAAFSVDLLDEPIQSACISPDQRLIAVVGDDGQAFIGHIDTSVADLLPKRIHGPSSYAWSTRDQLAYITDSRSSPALNVYDVATAQNHHIADIADQDWSLAAADQCH
jgi:hypothetical protein